MSTPTNKRLRWVRAGRLIAVSLLTVALASMSAAPTLASVSEEQQGARLLGQVQNSQSTCGKLSSSQFELIGEYVMGRMLGSSAAHDAMNAQMQTVMGSSGEQLAHQFMGRRFAGCATGNGPAQIGTMMGMMGTAMMGASYGSSAQGNGYGPSMMGGAYRPYMMGGYGSNQTVHDSDMNAGAIIAIVLGGLAVLALVVVLAVRMTARRQTRPRGA
jgi:hypothetical protein